VAAETDFARSIKAFGINLHAELAKRERGERTFLFAVDEQSHWSSQVLQRRERGTKEGNVHEKAAARMHGHGRL